MRSPDELAATWLAQFRGYTGAVDRADLADLLRWRDAEHEALRREERRRAFDAGAEAVLIYSGTGKPTVDALYDARDQFEVARRAAIEGAGEPGEEQP